MDDRDQIRTTLRILARRLRLVRGVTAGVRFLSAGLALALAPLLLKGSLPGAGARLAGLLVAGGTVLGLVYGLAMRIEPGRVARLADRRLGLKERLACAEEHLDAEPATDLVRAQLAETAARARGLRPQHAFPLRLGPETRLVGPLAALALALALLPPLPVPFTAGGVAPDREESNAAEAPAERPLEQKLSPPHAPKVASPRMGRQDAQRGPLSSRSQEGDQAATFRDSPMSQQRPDFGSFVKQGDERLKLLARPESLPDLKRDFTQNPYQVMIRSMQDKLKAGSLQGLTWEQVEQLLSQLGQAERRMGGGGASDELRDLLEQNRGSAEKMMSALSRALNRLREKDEAARGQGKELKDAPGRQEGSDRGRGEGREGGQEGGEPGGSLPGTEKSLQTRRDPTPRIGGEKQDSTLEGELREGRTEAYDTNLSGLGAQTPSRLPYLDVFSQYRKQMEEALAREPIPFSYREQVKEYFKALEATEAPAGR